MSLERERSTYREHFPELALHEGRFVLIHGNEIVDTFSSYADALRQGYRQFGLEPFLVKQIQLVEQVQYVTRAITPHHAV